MPRIISYKCPKCANLEAELGEMRAKTNFLSKMFDIDNANFTTVTCTKCKYTEFFRADRSFIEKIFDMSSGI